MKIGIDVSQAIYNTGVAVYTRHLVENLLKVNREDSFILFGGSLRRREDLAALLNGWFKLNRKVTKRLTWFSPRVLDLLWNRLHVFPIEQLVGRIDVFHSSDWAEPPARFSAKVTTVHDLSPLLFPQETPNFVREAHIRRLNWVKKESKLIIAVSESTEADLINHLGIEKSRIRVIYEAASPDIKKASAKRIVTVKKKLGIKGGYLLAVGSSMRKNIARIISASKRVRKDRKKLSLVIVGQPDLAREAGFDRLVKFVGPVSDQELAALYSGAACLVSPSLYEGFGLPILEAFSCGCPVVTSNLSSMPEVAGDAAVLVDPKIVEEIAAGINQAIKNQKELVEKGYAQAEKFSWEKASRETLAVYEEAIRQ